MHFNLIQAQSSLTVTSISKPCSSVVKYWRKSHCSRLRDYISHASFITSIKSCWLIRHIYKLYTETHTRTHARTHTRTFNGPLSRTTRVSQDQKVKPIWILLKQEIVSCSGIRWAICKSAPRSRQTTMPAPHRSVFYRPDALPDAQPTASKHRKQKTLYWKWINKPTMVQQLLCHEICSSCIYTESLSDLVVKSRACLQNQHSVDKNSKVTLDFENIHFQWGNIHSYWWRR